MAIAFTNASNALFAVPQYSCSTHASCRCLFYLAFCHDKCFAQESYNTTLLVGGPPFRSSSALLVFKLRNLSFSILNILCQCRQYPKSSASLLIAKYVSDRGPNCHPFDEPMLSLIWISLNRKQSIWRVTIPRTERLIIRSAGFQRIRLLAFLNLAVQKINIF